MFKTRSSLQSERELSRCQPTERRAAERLRKRLARIARERLARTARERRRQARVDSLPPARRALVERVRAQMAAGTYLTEEKIEIALDLALREMAEQAVTV